MTEHAIRPGNSQQTTAALLEQTTASHPEALAYCRRLAESHYENFVVASFFLPAHLKQHFYNIYSYCRISDDLADESPDPQTALTLLDRWHQMLQACYEGQSTHPVFVALRETINRFEIPITPFADLLQAFRLDQTKQRYETYDELLGYCRYSANPAGHLILYLGGYRDAERRGLSDCTCTALQLANHWQDIGRDLQQLDRIYLPRQDMAQYGYSEADLKNHICDQRFTRLMQMEVDRARALFHKGLALCGRVDRRLSRDIKLFNLGGMEVLKGLEAVGFDMFRHRPSISKWTSLKLLLKCWWQPGSSE